MTGSLQEKNSKYYIVLNTYENGRRKQKWIATGLPVKGNKRKAEKLLQKYIFESNGTTTDTSEAMQELYSDYLSRWLVAYSKHIDECTLQTYTHLVEKHIKPYFKDEKIYLSSLSRKDIQEFLDKKFENGRLDGKGGLSSKSVKELKNIINLSLEEAMREEIIESNPCSLIILPKREKFEAHFYSQAQLNLLIEVAKNDELYSLICVDIFLGLRRSELLGLKWDSIDFENNTITIKHTVVKVNKLIEKDKTKTKSSYRTFPMTNDLRSIFINIKAKQKDNKELFKSEYIDTDYIFCWSNGKPYSPDYVSKHFSLLLRQNNLPHIRFHELRHSCASLLINDGCNLKDVQAWMGHSDIGVTADIYGHLFIERKKEIASKMGSMLIC